MTRIGVDLGGTKIEIAALDPTGAVRHRRRVATPTDDYSATLVTVAQLVEDAEKALGEHASVGVCSPGSVSPRSGLIRNANSTCLNGRPLRADLAALLRREVRVANDADCFTISEATDGAGAGASSVFGVILGTGVGGGIMIEGRLVRGANAIAGEWGHNPLPLPDAHDLPLPLCYCGRRGCIETYLSGPAMAAEHARLTGLSLQPPEIAADAERGGLCSEASMERYERRLARALATVINLLDPQVIVLGGGLSKLERLYRNVPRYWPAYVFSDVITTRLAPNLHGDASGVRGAAWLWQAQPGEVDSPR